MDKPFTKIIKNMNELECFDCFGNGQIEGGNPICNKPHSICCGGCDSNFTCPTCLGQGTIESEDEITKDYFEILKAYKTIISGLKTALLEVDRLNKKISEDAALEMELLLNHEYQEEKSNIKRQMKRIEKHTEILHNEIRENLKGNE